MTWLSDESWSEIQASVPIVCVDVLPWLLDPVTGVPSCSLIVRADENGWPRLALVGGRVRLDETLEDAIARHIHSTLGSQVSWEGIDVDKPYAVGQYLRQRRDGYGFDPRKHAVALSYVAEIQGPVTPHGEALDVKAFSASEPPPASNIGFDQAAVVTRLFDVVARRT